MRRIAIAGGFAVFALLASPAWSKIPPPPPLDEKGKAAAEDAAVKNYQGNMRKAGKPIPKPVAVVPPAPPAPAAAAPAAAPPAAPAKDAAKKS